MNMLKRLLDFHIYKEVLTVNMRKQAIHDYEWFKEITNTVEPYLGDLRDKEILDIGCGRTYPLTLLFHSFGSRAVGIDTEYIGINDPLIERWWKRLRRNGVLITGGRLLYTLLRKYKTYYATLGQMCAFPLKRENIDVRMMSVEEMTFPNETFDLVVSVAVFEHVPDVARAVSEISRVMKKKAIAYINIHLFTSLSGGHRRFPDHPSTWRVPPWDHLRENRYPTIGFVNKLREQEYLSLFREKLDILEVLDIDKGEGKELLTPEIRQELLDYSEEELTKRGITIIATKV